MQAIDTERARADRNREGYRFRPERKGVREGAGETEIQETRGEQREGREKAKGSYLVVSQLANFQ